MASERKNLEQRERQWDGTETPREKQQYSAPRLMEYGTLAKLTRAKVAGAADAVMSPCL